MAGLALRQRMAVEATAWLESLSAPQRRKAHYGFPTTEERTRWFYTPNEQGGLPLVEMDPVQQRLAHRLLASGLSRPGYTTAATIMGLENPLDASEGWRRHYAGRAAPNRGRDPQLYYFTVFGDPAPATAGDADAGPAAAWGWRVGGHHLSVSYTLVGDRLAATPLFFGANPAATALVGPGVLRPLAGEEDLARELLAALSPQERAAALLSEIAPGDILQFNRPMVRGLGDPEGVAAATMTAVQHKLLVAVLRQYLDRLPDEVAASYAQRLSLNDHQSEAFAAIHFAWAGRTIPGQGHYYRLQGPRLLIEYDCTQDRANHIHAVLRDPVGDFGADLLA
jgi:hypothetical protein